MTDPRQALWSAWLEASAELEAAEAKLKAIPVDESTRALVSAALPEEDGTGRRARRIRGAVAVMAAGCSASLAVSVASGDLHPGLVLGMRNLQRAFTAMGATAAEAEKAFRGIPPLTPQERTLIDWRLSKQGRRAARRRDV